MKPVVKFGTNAGTQAADAVGEIKAAVAAALMGAGLPGALSINLDKLGEKGLSGTLNLKPTISKKDGRVMYNLSGEVIIGEEKIKPMGNWLLNKGKFTVDADTLKAYQVATAERDAKRTKRGEQTEEELEAGETTT